MCKKAVMTERETDKDLDGGLNGSLTVYNRTVLESVCKACLITVTVCGSSIPLCRMLLKSDRSAGTLADQPLLVYIALQLHKAPKAATFIRP